VLRRCAPANDSLMEVLLMGGCAESAPRRPRVTAADPRIRVCAPGPASALGARCDQREVAATMLQAAGVDRC